MFTCCFLYHEALPYQEYLCCMSQKAHTMSFDSVAGQYMFTAKFTLREGVVDMLKHPADLGIDSAFHVAQRMGLGIEEDLDKNAGVKQAVIKGQTLIAEITSGVHDEALGLLTGLLIMPEKTLKSTQVQAAIKAILGCLYGKFLFLFVLDTFLVL